VRLGEAPPAFFVHEPGAKESLGLELVVRSTPQTQVRDGGLTATRNWLDVIELQIAARFAWPA